VFKKISHVGLAVKNLDRAIEFYRDVLHMKITDRKKIEDQGVEVAFVDIGGTAQLELLAPLNDHSPIARFLKQRGPGIHHFCVEVDNLEQQIAYLTDHGVTMVDTRPRMGAEGDRIAFVHPKSMLGALIELKEAD